MSSPTPESSTPELIPTEELTDQQLSGVAGAGLFDDPGEIIEGVGEGALEVGEYIGEGLLEGWT